MSLLLKYLVLRLFAGLAFGIAIFGFWRAVDAPMPWPFVRLCLGGLIGIAVFRFFIVRSSPIRTLLMPFPTAPESLRTLPRWVYAAVVVLGLVAAGLVAF